MIKRYFRMHITIAISTIIVVAYRGVWKDWKQYHSTMLFFASMELIYNSISKEKDYFLWKIIPDLNPSRIPVIGLYIFIIFPLTALLYLRKWPNDPRKQVFHVAKWVAMYTFVEGIGSVFNRIVYDKGWDLWHSFIFNIVLFTGLILHHKKPVTAYIIFLIVTVLGIWVYKIPL
jgi:hypothetical protein